MATSTIRPKIVIFLGSTRKGRMCERVAKLVESAVSDGGMEPILLDPAKLPFEMLHEPLHFMKNPEQDAPQWMKDANGTILDADGAIIVSPEYNCTLPPALTNMMDHFSPRSYRHKPCGIVTYSLGSYGGVRASLAMLPFISELGLVGIPASVTIPTVSQQIDEDGKATSDRVTTNMNKLVTELSWYVNAIGDYKRSNPLPS